MNDKVMIEVTEGHNFVPSVYNGCAYISVKYGGKLYGGSSPCIDDEEVRSSIENAKEIIKEAGDIPILQDQRKKATLLNWFGGQDDR